MDDPKKQEIQHHTAEFEHDYQNVYMFYHILPQEHWPRVSRIDFGGLPIQTMAIWVLDGFCDGIETQCFLQLTETGCLCWSKWSGSVIVYEQQSKTYSISSICF